jgi:Zn-dependent peptidase ImmA (M78 family)
MAADDLTPSPQEEKLATCFARNLLMPQESLREAVDAQRREKGKLSFDDLFEIARQFDVSVEALLRHIGFVYNLDSAVVQQQIDRLLGQMSFWDERERDTPSERPLRFRALARQALRKGLISTGRYAEYLGITRREAMQVVEQDAEEDVEVEVAHP